MLTNIWKSKQGWKAETNVKDVYDDYCLKIATYKDYRGLVTSASCYKSEGRFERHEVYKDFYCVLKVTNLRCTEKAVEKQHDDVLSQLDLIKAMVSKHYKGAQQ